MAPGSHARAAAILCGFLLCFFWTPLTSRGFFAPVDLLRDWPMVQSESPPLKNYLLSDPAIQFLPFLEWNKAEIRAGRLPAWNPYSGWGAPHIANAQSAVFSPYTLPYYLFDWRWALILAHWCKLFVPAFFAYLFLRECGCAFWPALAGGVLFAFNGFHTVWLLWNHSAASGTLAPALYCFERYVRRQDPRALAGLALSLAAGMLAGHPETFFFVVALFVAYAAFRLLWFDDVRGRRMRVVAWTAAACLLGAAVSAAQTLPFLEYLRHSAEVSKAVRHAPMPWLHWTAMFLQISPDLFGNPSTPYRWHSATNYNELNSAYCGIGALFLVGLAIVTWRWHRSPRIGFFLLALLAWGVYAFDPLSLYARWISAIPLIGMGVPKRSGGVGAFLAVCIAAHVLDWLARREERRGLTAYSLVFWIALFNVMFWALPLMNLTSNEAREVLTWRLAAIALSLAALMIWCGSGSARFAWILPCVFFAQTGLQFRDYNPTVDAPTLFPESKALRAVGHYVREDQTHWDRSAGLFSVVNLPYRFRLTTNYDAVQIGHYDRMAFLISGRDTPRSYQVLGVRHVITKLAEPGKWLMNEFPAGATVTRATIAGRRMHQVFRVKDRGLIAIKLPIGVANDAGPECRLAFTVTRLTDARVIAHDESPCKRFADSSDHWIRMPGQYDQERLFRVDIDGTRATGTTAVFVTTGWSPDSPDPAPQPNGNPGVYLEATAGSASALKLMGDREGFLLYDVRDPMPRFHSVGRAERRDGYDETVGRVMDHEFDYLRAIVLAEDPPARPQSDEAVTPEVLEDTPTRIRLMVTRKTPGWLYALQPYYPGWSAVVNGREEGIWRANGAFTAVPLEAGRSEVVLEYRPLSLRIGLALSLAGLIACAALWRRR